MRMYMCALPPGQLIFYLFTGCSVINTWTTKLFFISLYLSTTDVLPQKSHCAWHLIETHKACAESCFMFKKKRFCLLLYESLSAHIVYAKSKICNWLLWNACAPSCHVSDRFTYMAINTPHQTKLLSEIAIVFSFSIFMQVICCAMSPYSAQVDQVCIEPLFALSLFLALSKSVNLFPNCKLSAGERASFTAGVKY